MFCLFRLCILWWMDNSCPLRQRHMADISFIVLRSLSNHGRFVVLTSSLVFLETKTRYSFTRNCAYTYALIIWLKNIWNLWKAKLSLVSFLCIGDEHSLINNLVSLVPWRLHFDGSVLKAIAIILVLFIDLLMVLFLKPHAT